MFTGIVQGVATVVSVTEAGEVRSIDLRFPEGFCEGLARGASVAVDGACLTATEALGAEAWRFDVVSQSLRMTTLGSLRNAHHVNVERAAKDGAEIGGHPLSGHVDFTSEVLDVASRHGNKLIRFSISKPHRPYLFDKGYVAVNGSSLTIADIDRDEGWFEVWLIPETRRATTFDALSTGDRVNVEIDRGAQVVVDTIRETVTEIVGRLFPRLEAALERREVAVEDLLDPGETKQLIEAVRKNL